MDEIERPELLRPLTTHHVARRFRALSSDTAKSHPLPARGCSGPSPRRRPKPITPVAAPIWRRTDRSLEGRKYVIEAGRQWYEIWVPQNPNAWIQPKLVFRDIAQEPTFWVDLNGSVVNGDCYWLVAQNPADVDLLWLAAAIANSTFIERFYDLCFHNKLYAGRRRFMTQYVENFPLPDPQNSPSKYIIAKAKRGTRSYTVPICREA